MTSLFLRSVSSVLISLLTLSCLSACKNQEQPEITTNEVHRSPAQQLKLLSEHLHRNDLIAFTKDAIPADMYQDLEMAWSENRTRWPLEELPLSPQLPNALKALAAKDAEQKLNAVFDRQFSGQNDEMHNAASSLGNFTIQYLEHSKHFSDDERQHYTQITHAIASWAQRTTLDDKNKAHQAIRLLTQAVTSSELVSEHAFSRFGLTESLKRFGGTMTALKQAASLYGLHFDQALNSVETSLVSQTGETAIVRMTYTLAEMPIDTTIHMQRIQGKWYVQDFVNHAKTGIARPSSVLAPEAQSTKK